MNKTQLLAALRADLADQRALVLAGCPGHNARRNTMFNCPCGTALTANPEQIARHVSWHEKETPHLLWWRLRALHPYLPIPAFQWKNGDYVPHLYRLYGPLCNAHPTSDELNAVDLTVWFIGKQKQLLREAGFNLPRHADSRSFILMRQPEVRFIMDLFQAGETVESIAAVFQSMARERHGTREVA